MKGGNIMSGKEVLRNGLLYGFALTIGIAAANAVIEKVKEKFEEHDED